MVKSDSRYSKLSLLKRRIKLAGLAALPLMIADLAQAQVELEEIVVTAQKREESVQDIPIAVTALSSTLLEETGFDNVEDLTSLVPSLQFSNFGAVAFTNIRGIGSENTTAGSDPGVALHLDGVYIGRPVGAIFTAFDSERVEVLRGPQGTLYGRNATGGSINLITNKPTDELEGNLDATLGNYNHVRLRGVLNAPISDSVRARIVAFKEDRDGWTTNTSPTGNDANDADNLGLRAHIEFDLADNASLLLSGTYVEIGGAGSQPEQRDPYPPIGVPIGGPVPPLSIIGADNDLNPFVEAKDQAEITDLEFTMLAATLNWELENFTIKSITSYGETEIFNLQDNDSSPAFIQNLTLTETAEQFAQEIQFLSPEDAAFKWIVGAYFFNEEARRRSEFDGPRWTAAVNAVNQAFGINLPAIFSVGGEIETNSYALFGQTTFDITDSLKLTTGLRYTDDEKDGLNNNVLDPDGGFGPMPPAFFRDNVRVTSSEVAGRISLDWALTDESLVYGSYARGYKSGGVNQTASPLLTNVAYRPEFVDTFEIGYKSRLFEDRVQFNVAAYTSDYTDLQFQIFGAGGIEAGNAEGATIEGAEFEWQVLLGENWRLDGNAAYTDASYDTNVTAVILSPATLTPVGIAGKDIPRVPEWTYGLGLTGEWDLSDAGTFKVRLEGSYKDDVFYTPENSPTDFAEDYYNVNLRLFWASADQRFNAEAFVTNLTDEVQINNILIGFAALNAAAGDTGPEFTTYKAPRQVGVTLGYNF